MAAENIHRGLHGLKHRAASQFLPDIKLVRRALIAFSCLSAFSLCAADIPTGPPETVDPNFVGARIIDVLDWDQEGKLDIVGGAFDGRDLSVWRNQEFGWVEQTIPFAHPVTDLDVGDVDGDGTTDFVYSAGDSSGSDDRIGVVLNRASTLRVPIDNTLDQPICITLFDPDNDGDLDAASCELGSGQVSLHINKGDGESWINGSIATPGGPPIDAVASDIDLDGDQDLVIVTYTQTFTNLVWLENRLDEPSTSWLVHDIDSDVPAGIAVDSGDIDGDGQDEIVFGAINMPLLAFYDRPPVITDAWTQTVIQSSYAVADVDLRDLDQDGDLDVLATRWSPNGDLRYWQNDGAGAFIEQDLGGDYQTPRATATADFDLDGDLDFAVAGGNSNVVDTIENQTIRSSVRFEDAQGDFRGSAFPIAFGMTDLDGDGDIDVVSYDSDERLRYRDNMNDPGTLLQATSAVLNDPQAFALADMDNDGDVDVVLGLDDGLEWLENNGFGNQFSRNTLNNTSNNISDVLIIDLNLDGDLDVIAFDSVTNDLYWWRNLGDAMSFFRNTIRSSLSTYRDVAAVDLDADTQPELILASDGSMKALTRIADTVFSEETIASRDTNHIVTGDFDVDGDIDVIGQTSESIYLYRNNDNGIWTWIVTSFEDQIQTLHAIDIDRDGDLDIFGGRSAGAIWLENRRGALAPVARDLGGLQSGLLQFGDVDRDGDQDPTGVEGGGAIQWVETVRGQIRVEPARPADTTIEFGTQAQLLRIDVQHLGRPTDEPIELDALAVTFEESLFGAPLDAATIDELFARLFVLRREGNAVMIAELTAIEESSPILFTIQEADGAEVIAPPGPGFTASSIAVLEVWGELERDYSGPLESIAVRLKGSSDVLTAGSSLQPLTSGCCGGVLNLIRLDDTLFTDRFEGSD